MNKYLQIIGYCACGYACYWDEQEDQLIFTCDEAPCYIETDRRGRVWEFEEREDDMRDEMKWRERNGIRETTKAL